MAESNNIQIKREGAENQINIQREVAVIHKLPTGAVTSVNGQTGDVVLTADDVGAIGDEELVDFTYEEWDQLWQ